MKLNKYLLLLIVFCLGVQPVNRIKSLPFVIPIVTYTIGSKVTPMLIAKLVCFTALLAICVYKNREIPENDRNVLNKIQDDAGRGGGGRGGQGPKDPKWDKKKWLERAAELLGFIKSKDKSHGESVFRDGNESISFDRDSHSAAFWKRFHKDKRIGSYDIFLEKRIGD